VDMASATNEIKRQKFNAWIVLFRQFKNPLLLIFIVATIVSYALGQNIEATVIWIIMAVSILLGFWNEYQAGKIVNDLIKRISLTTTVIRNGVRETISVRNVRTGDLVEIFPGSIVPADVKLEAAEHLEVNESLLTGESLPSAKNKGDAVYMGTVVTGGVGRGTVTAIGMDTKFGKISKDVSKNRPETEFQKGLRSFSTLLAKIAGVAVVAIIILGAFLHHPIVETVLFALTVAMGITPELLPLIVTLSLSYGAKRLAKKNVIIKQFVSVEDLGNMEVICSDKTGTLTEGKISLQSYVNKEGGTDEKVLDMALTCNSIFVHQQVFGGSIDRTIWEFAESKKYKVKEKYKKIYQIPFNFENRFMTIVVESNKQKLLICKGSPEAILNHSKVTSDEKGQIEKRLNEFQKRGLRTIAVAWKSLESFDEKNIKDDIKDLDFKGILTFSDIPKKDLAAVFGNFERLRVKVKIITGDNEVVTQRICDDVGFKYKDILLGPEIAKMSDPKLAEVVWKIDIFARVTPSQKTRVIEALKKGGHTVGYLGDGVNDGPALRAADIGISVNTAVDVAKDAASVVLLRKSLTVIADGVTEGRIIFNNTIKYILMGTSSDFGNMLSASAASIFLPFLPMTPVQVLLTDILYDVSQLSIPTDRVDSDQIVRPKRWDLGYIKKFMWVFGPISTIYDFLTFAVMYFAFAARGKFFQTGWFVESLVTEILVVFVIRTRKIPFFRSRPSLPILATCLSVVAIGLFLPFSPLASYLDFMPLPAVYFEFMLMVAATYLIFVEIGKFFLNKERFD
jgi:Mg2+-importing ATPase